METKDRSSTDGLVWVKVDPSAFAWQYHGSKLLIDDEGTTSDHIVNKIHVTSSQTGGRLTALDVIAVSTGGATAVSSGCDYGMAAYFENDIEATVTSRCWAVGIWTNLTGGTPTEYIAPLQVGLYEDGATLSSITSLSVLNLTHQVADAPAANSFSWIELGANGAEMCDHFITATNLAELPAVVMTTADRAIGTNSGDYAIKVYLGNQAGTQQWYIPLMCSL
jgi:hypothetical protein